jgi:hypothetical protein
MLLNAPSGILMKPFLSKYSSSRCVKWEKGLTLSRLGHLLPDNLKVFSCLSWNNPMNFEISTSLKSKSDMSTPCKFGHPVNIPASMCFISNMCDDDSFKSLVEKLFIPDKETFIRVALVNTPYPKVSKLATLWDNSKT